MLKILNSILLLLILLSSTSSYAADDGDWWLQRQIQLQQNREDYARRVYGSARHTYDTVDPITSKTKTITKTVIVEDVPSKAKLGKGLLQRAKSFKGGVAGVLGGAAVTALIEGVGWVMEDGTWVKYKDQENDGFEYTLIGYAFWEPSKELACTQHAEYYLYNGSGLPNTLYISSVAQNLTCQITFLRNKDKPTSKDIITSTMVSRPSSTTPKPQRIVITDQDVGGIVSGDYKDPVDQKFDITDKQYRPVVADAYQHDPNGIGNDLPTEMDDKIKNAPPTQDGQPAPIGDPRYSQPPEDDQSTNDRSWGDDTANEATGDTTPNTDPITGQPTGGQSISLQFPIFCEWAHSMCKWYDDWKASDKVYKDHMTKTEEHQTQEKTFWQSVKDWFSWTKDESDLPDRDDTDLNITTDFEEKTVTLNVSAQCPAPTYETVVLHGVTSQVKTSDYSFICSLDWLIKPFVIGFSMVTACFILLGFQRGGDD